MLHDDIRGAAGALGGGTQEKLGDRRGRRIVVGQRPEMLGEAALGRRPVDGRQRPFVGTRGEPRRRIGVAVEIHARAEDTLGGGVEGQQGMGAAAHGKPRLLVEPLRVKAVPLRAGSVDDHEGRARVAHRRQHTVGQVVGLGQRGLHDERRPGQQGQQGQVEPPAPRVASERVHGETRVGGAADVGQDDHLDRETAAQQPRELRKAGATQRLVVADDQHRRAKLALVFGEVLVAQGRQRLGGAGRLVGALQLH
ncbi:MAG: hypothetical protein ACYTA3_11950, partial [Planctomycetota bacterium]